MKELYLHIGTPKTGTTALQLFFAKNKDILLEKGICYPFFSEEDEKIGKRVGGGGNARCLYDLDLGKDIGQFGEVEYSLVQKIENALDGNPKVLLSCEMLLYNLRICINLLKLLRKKYEIKAKVIVYLRRQDEWLESLWNEVVKEGITCETFEQYVRKAVEVNEDGHYKKILKNASKIVGKENLSVRVYDQGKFSKGNGNSIYADFMSLLGVKDLSEFEIPKSRSNPSLGRNAVEIRRIFNSISDAALMEGKINEAIKNIGNISSTGNIVKAPSLLTYEQRKALLDYYEKENREIGREYFGIDASPFPPLEERQEDEDAKILNGGGYLQFQDIVGVLGQILVSQEQEIERLHYAVDEFELSRDIPKGSRVVVYGAGNKGRIAYHWIKRKHDYEVVGIVDKRDDFLRSVVPDVRPRKDIFEMDYDYILIAVKVEAAENDIQAWLEDNGVDRERIVRVI